MLPIMSFLSSFLGLYSLLIFIRIILTWFDSTRHSAHAVFLSRITDPYLNWWRKNLNLRVGILDLSPLAGIIALSVAQTICSTIVRQGRISLGVILAVCLSALWSAVSFILGLCLIVLVLRFFAYLSNRDIYGIFWQTIDTISRPLLYRVNRIIFGKKIINYMTSIVVSIAALAALWVFGGMGVRLLIGFLFRSSL